MFRESQQIGPYTLIQKLGRGTFGEVWLAENRAKFATTQVAVKLPLDEQIDHALVEQEAQLWAKASGHPNVLPIIEANEYDGQIVIVSEYSPDGSLDRLLKNNGGKLLVEQAVEITIGILKGLQFLHSRKIIHRDLKPDNVLMQGETPRLADFGISRVIKSSLHATNAAGTPYYMSPEAFKRERTEQTDLWSIGVMLYQMLKGELPFLGNHIAEIYVAVTEEEPAPLSDDIPLSLQKMVTKSLSKDLTERYQTADEMRKELNSFLAVQSHQASPLPTQSSITQKIEEPASSGPTPDREEYKKTKQSTFQPFTPLSAPPQPKTNLLYFVVPAIILLLAVGIGGGYWLENKTKNNEQLVANTSTTNSPRPSPAATPLQDKNNETILIPFRKGDKFGFSDTNKKLIIAAKYDFAEFFSEGLARVKLKDKYGFIDKSGNEIIPPKYDSASFFSEDIAQITLNNKYGFIDKLGNEIAPPKYDIADFFSEGLASVGLNNKYGFIDKSGNEIIPLKYDEAFEFSEGLAPVKLNNEFGFIDKTGKVIIPLKYEFALSFSEGLAQVELNGKNEYIDKSGNEIIKPKCNTASSFNEGMAEITLNNKYGFIDKSGKEIIPPKYDIAKNFFEGLAQVELNNKYGFIDKTGKVIIPLKYDYALSFSEGLAAVTLNGKNEYIDKSGKVIIPPKYEINGYFKEGFAQVKLNNKEIYIDKNGAEYYEP